MVKHFPGDSQHGDNAGKRDFVHEHLPGAPRTITAGTGAPVWAWDRDPFGNGQPQAAGGFVYNLRLPGQYYDAETGLLHNNARDYDPVTGEAYFARSSFRFLRQANGRVK